MQKLMKIISFLVILILSNEIHGQKLKLITPITIEPQRPYIKQQLSLPRISKPEMVNGKIQMVLESDEDYERRIDEYKAELNEKFKNSLEYKNWLKEHAEWRKKTPNWKTKTSYKDLINEFEPKLTPKLGEAYNVTSKSINLRSEPSKESSIITSLKQGDEVTLLKSENQWWYVSFKEYKGYVFAESLKLNPYSGWNKKNYESGITPECENVIPKYDYNLANYLRIIVGSGTDVVLKLMKIGSGEDECIRIVYVRSKESFDIKYIPEGRYYVKIAYGKDYRQKIVDNTCYVKFMQNAHYEKGKEILDFNRIEKPDTKIGNQTYKNWMLPTFTLSLDVIQTNFNRSTFNSDQISESEFNN